MSEWVAMMTASNSSGVPVWGVTLTGPAAPKEAIEAMGVEVRTSGRSKRKSW
jgi:hypothetical protein